MHSENVVERMCKALAVKNKSALAESLRIRPSVISSWISRNSIPDEYLYKISTLNNISVEWLLTGNGEMLLTQGTTSKSDLSPDLIKSLNDALYLMGEERIVEILKKSVIEEILSKLKRPTSKIAEFFDFLLKGRSLLFIYEVICQSTVQTENHSSREWLIESIKKLDLLKLKNIDKSFTAFTQNDMIKKVNTLTDEDCNALVDNLPEVKKLLNDSLPTLTKASRSN